jgi:hypothetical protein
MAFTDKCDKCNNIMVFKVLMEDEYDPTKHHVENLCENCLYEFRAGVIEAWTFAEWDDE